MAHHIADSARTYFDLLAKESRSLDFAAIDTYAEMIYDAWKNDRRVFVFGNGGSAYNASHHVCDYVKTASVPGKKRLFAISLMDNIGLGTAIGNDLSYEETMSFPLESYAQTGDLAVAISCSGNSPNVLKACRWARANGLAVVALTGFEGGKLAELADLHVNVPSDNYGVIEDLHMSIGHVAAQILHQRISSEGAAF